MMQEPIITGICKESVNDYQGLLIDYNKSLLSLIHHFLEAYNNRVCYIKMNNYKRQWLIMTNICFNSENAEAYYI